MKLPLPCRQFHLLTALIPYELLRFCFWSRRAMNTWMSCSIPAQGEVAGLVPMTGGLWMWRLVRSSRSQIPSQPGGADILLLCNGSGGHRTHDPVCKDSKESLVAKRDRTRFRISKRCAASRTGWRLKLFELVFLFILKRSVVIFPAAPSEILHRPFSVTSTLILTLTTLIE
ncbi:uncharacterized protein CC84DRAFT_603106 [Paraphaeosphaeria sporulosa]|uniref:Uncharacterized protein n=1 Tax=Paraphaeosphaeria sporulosa TaxID=1460663 RepID=A0A177CNI8_9PLEO|nr:uncharacterized protein CC84DRAFT_603106 [Paraphaeosphaeria sporulosa]OAG09064.1 hypothetical protein CC84DRAFT_603106 [Paraphaeosphaeria sporulosa]